MTQLLRTLAMIDSALSAAYRKHEDLRNIADTYYDVAAKELERDETIKDQQQHLLDRYHAQLVGGMPDPDDGYRYQ